MENRGKIFPYRLIYSEQVPKKLFSLNILKHKIDIRLVHIILMQPYYIGMIQFFHGIYFLQGNKLIILRAIIDFNNPKELGLTMLDFSKIWVIASADVTHEVIFLEDGGCFSWDELPSF